MMAASTPSFRLRYVTSAASSGCLQIPLTCGVCEHRGTPAYSGRPAQKPHWRAVYRLTQAGADEAAAVKIVLRSCFGGEVGVGWLHTKIILTVSSGLRRAPSTACALAA